MYRGPVISGCPRIEKNDKINETGEYKIRPDKGFPGERRGEPCVHPAFSDSLIYFGDLFLSLVKPTPMVCPAYRYAAIHAMG